MTIKALVVDDDPNIIEVVADILESLEHEFDSAATQHDARQLIAENSYSYVLLDLEIPVRKGSFARIENGGNLLEEVLDRFRYQVPVIIITGSEDGIRSPKIAVEMMKRGAVDYVMKPFASSGDTLDKAILEALGGTQTLKSARPDSSDHEPITFTGGEFVVFYDRIEVCGVAVPIGEITHRLLLELNQKRADDYIGFSGRELADRIEHAGGQGTVSNAILDLRTKIETQLLTEANVRCGRQDVIQSGNQGYRFRDWMTVRIATPSRGSAPQNVPDVSNQVGKGVPNVPKHLNERQTWIMKQLDQNIEVQVSLVVQHFGCSSKTVKRDLVKLREAGLIEFVGPSRSGHYVKR